MGKASELHVCFGAFGFGYDPTVVTQAMGVAPTTAWIKGAPITNARGGKQTHSRWVLQSTLPLTEPIEAHFDNLLPQLENRRDAVAEVVSRFEASLCVAAYWYEVNPGFQLTANTIRRVAALGLEVDFNLYYLGGSGSPGSSIRDCGKDSPT